MSDERLIEALLAPQARAAAAFAVRELHRRHRTESAEPAPGGAWAGASQVEGTTVR